MYLDRQEINQEVDEINALGQQHIPIIVFFSYLLSIIFTEKIDCMRKEAECENKKTRKDHFHCIIVNAQKLCLKLLNCKLDLAFNNVKPNDWYFVDLGQDRDV